MDKYMKHVRYAGILLMAFMGFSSCGDDFLEVIPKDQVAASTIFSNETIWHSMMYTKSYRIWKDGVMKNLIILMIHLNIGAIMQYANLTGLLHIVICRHAQ